MKYNLLQYAYIGDAYYELLVRDYLCDSNIVKTKELNSKALNFVSAKSQAYYLKVLEEDLFFNDLELDIIRKGRNAKVSSKPKNCDILTYKHATAFEVLIGYLYKENKIDRIKEIFNKIIEIEGKE